MFSAEPDEDNVSLHECGGYDDDVVKCGVLVLWESGPYEYPDDGRSICQVHMDYEHGLWCECPRHLNQRFTDQLDANGFPALEDWPADLRWKDDGTRKTLEASS